MNNTRLEKNNELWNKLFHEQQLQAENAMKEALSKKIETFAATLSPGEFEVLMHPDSLTFAAKILTFRSSLSPTECALFGSIRKDREMRSPPATIEGMEVPTCRKCAFIGDRNTCGKCDNFSLYKDVGSEELLKKYYLDNKYCPGCVHNEHGEEEEECGLCIDGSQFKAKP